MAENNTNTQNKIVNYAALDKFRELVTAAYNKTIADAFIDKVGELKDKAGISYTVAQVVGTPITVETENGKTVVVSLKDLISAEVTRATNAENELSNRISETELDISTLKGIGEGSISKSVENAIAIKAVKVDGTELTPDASKAINITGIKVNADAIAKLNGDSTVTGSVAKAVADAKSELTTEINKKADKATTIAGYNITDAYTKTEVNNKLVEKQDVISDLATIRSDASTGAGLVTQVNANKTNIESLQSAIDTLNGASTVEGSVDNKVAEAIAGVVANAPADFDTLKEVADWIANDTTGAAAMQTDIATLKTKVATVEENAEVNQNAFSNVTIDSTTIAANSKTDTLTLEAGSGINISADVASNKVTVANSGVRSITAGTSANQISVNTNGTASTITIDNVANAIAATNDSAGQAISSTYIKDLSVSGKVVTYTKGDGTTGTITTQDTVYAHPDSGVTTGTYRSVTVDVQGHVTAGTNPTTIAGYGITDAYTKSEIDTKIAAVSNQLVFATDDDITAMFA